jgi:hypothetical protein
MLVYERETGDGTYTLYQVDIFTGVKVMLDHGSLAPYTGRIIADRAMLVRTQAVTASGEVLDSDLVSVRLDGRDRIQLTSGPEIDRSVFLAGNRLVFSRQRLLPGGDRTTDVMSVRMDGSELRALAADDARNEYAELPSGEASRDHLVISAWHVPNGFSLSTVRVDGGAPAVPIAANPTGTTGLAFHTMVGERVVYSAQGKLYSAPARGGESIQLFAGAGARYYAACVGDRIVAAEIQEINGQWTTHLHMARVDGTDEISPLILSSGLVGTVPGTPDTLFLSSLVDGEYDLSMMQVGSSPGIPRLLSRSDRFTEFSGMEGDAMILKRAHLDDPQLGYSEDIVSLRETPTGISERVLARRADQPSSPKGYIGSTHGRLVLNSFSGSLPGGRALFEHYAITANGEDVTHLAKDSGFHKFEAVLVHPGGRVILKRTDFLLSAPDEALRSELMSVDVHTGSAIRLTSFDKTADRVGDF